jgi:predicted transcriptional regulator
MKRLAKERATAAEIAAQLGRSRAAIQQRLMSAGISLRALRQSKARGRSKR